MRYSPDELARLPDETDWAGIEAMSEAEIETAAHVDPAWDGLLDLDWSQAEVVVPPKKIPISIRIDEDVLAFFKAGGEGYQKRINAVLRSFVQQSDRAPRMAASRGKSAAKT